MITRVKIVVTVPAHEADDLRQAIGKAGGGIVGNYSYCSFSVSGTGRFKPNQQAKPAIGSANSLEEVAEDRIEVTCDKADARTIVEAIRAAHSYEEPAIDVYPLLEIEDL